jgi:hypothetical protein
MGDLKLTRLAASERRALALLSGCLRQLQHPRPTVDPSVPFFANFFFADTTPTPLSGEYL